MPDSFRGCGFVCAKVNSQKQHHSADHFFVTNQNKVNGVAWFLRKAAVSSFFGKLFSVATLSCFGEERCRKNLPSYEPSYPIPRAFSP